jgi:hypothetical protein
MSVILSTTPLANKDKNLILAAQPDGGSAWNQVSYENLSDWIAEDWGISSPINPNNLSLVNLTPAVPTYTIGTDSTPYIYATNGATNGALLFPTLSSSTNILTTITIKGSSSIPFTNNATTPPTTTTYNVGDTIDCVFADGAWYFNLVPTIPINYKDIQVDVATTGTLTEDLNYYKPHGTVIQIKFSTPNNSMDGIPISSGQLILIKNQNNPQYNGVYRVLMPILTEGKYLCYAAPVCDATQLNTVRVKNGTQAGVWLSLYDGNTTSSFIDISNLGSGGNENPSVSIDHTTFTNSYYAGSLVAGTQYLITDYQTKYQCQQLGDSDYFESDGVTRASISGPTEPIIVTATSSNTIDELATSLIYPDDELHYSVGSGIFRRVDKARNNDIACDFRAVQFRRYPVNVTNTYTAGGTYAKYAVVAYYNNLYLCINNTSNAVLANDFLLLPFQNGALVGATAGGWNMGQFTIPTGPVIPNSDKLMFQYYSENTFNIYIEQVKPGDQGGRGYIFNSSASDINIKGFSDSLNFMGTAYHFEATSFTNAVIGDNVNGVKINRGIQITNLIIGNNCSVLNLAGSSSEGGNANLYLGTTVNNLTTGENSIGNIICDNSNNNTIAHDCQQIVLRANSYNNTIHPNCSTIDIGVGSFENEVKFESTGITLGVNVSRSTIESYNTGITIGDNSYENTIGFSSTNITLGINVSRANIGDNNHTITIYDNAYDIETKTDVNTITFPGGSNNIKIDTGSNNIAFNVQLWDIVVGKSCSSLTFNANSSDAYVDDNIGGISFSSGGIWTTRNINLFGLNTVASDVKGAINELKAAEGGGGTSIVSTTYANLFNLYQSAQLSIGTNYLITDFETIYYQDNDSTRPLAGATEPLLITAISANQFDARVISLNNPSDEILYNIDGRSYQWNTPTSMGQIYFRKDAQNNQADFDFRNITTRRYYCDPSTLAQYDATGSTYYAVGTWLYSPIYDAVYLCAYADSNIVGVNPTAGSQYWVLALSNISTTLYCSSTSGLSLYAANYNITIPALAGAPVDLPTFCDNNGVFNNTANYNNTFTSYQPNQLPQLAVQNSNNIKASVAWGVWIYNSCNISDCFIAQCTISQSINITLSQNNENFIIINCQQIEVGSNSNEFIFNNARDCKLLGYAYCCLVVNSMFINQGVCNENIIYNSNSIDCENEVYSNYIYQCYNLTLEKNAGESTYILCQNYRVKCGGYELNIQNQNGGDLEYETYSLTLNGNGSLKVISPFGSWNGITIPSDTELVLPYNTPKEIFLNSNNKAFLKYLDLDNNTIFTPLN